MRITIAERLRPFSHLPGTCCVLPGSTLELQIFPTVIRIYDLAAQERRLLGEIAFDAVGPLADFTIQLDLEKQRLMIWGHSINGFLRYSIYAADQGRSLVFTLEKEPSPPLHWCCPKTFAHTIQDRVHTFMLPASRPATPPLLTQERLSLGNHKAQDWTLIQRRLDLSEILPIWLRLGQLLPASSATLEPLTGTTSLLTRCNEVIRSGHPECIAPQFLNLFMAGFHGMLSPRLVDDQYQGIPVEPLATDNHSLSPLLLLTEGASLIRSLFIQQRGSFIDILPALPPQFHAGRYLDLVCRDIGKLNIEWSKKAIRRMVMTAEYDGEVTFGFHRDLRRFRLRRSMQDKGKVMSCGDTLSIVAGERYLLDRFER